MGTIVQEYGPIYGEAVNGTVSGRPNGSVYIPEYNTITLSSGNDMIQVRNINGYRVELQYGRVVAVAQDLASYIKLALYDDAALTTEICHNWYPAGGFNYDVTYLRLGTIADPTDITSGGTYYAVAFLMNNGEAIATSDVLEVEAL